MLHLLERLLIGPAVLAATDLRPDVAVLQAPGRRPIRTAGDPIKVRLINTKPSFVEPFFNHLAGDTRSRNPD